ncbi:MAG: SEL1-like repeat protein [Clostridia bacterium]|nr:SEL1-like repeat protein [Clostridia bacterium]
MQKDIFISYKNDGSGNQFATRLCADLESFGYSVYFNSNEKRADSFPDRLKDAVSNCTDFILVVSKGCIEQLIANKEIDWVREEILTARKAEKHIIPILLENADFPSNANVMPEELRFLPHIDAIRFPEQYLKSPFSELTTTLFSKNDGQLSYRYTYNENSNYNITERFRSRLNEAENGDVEAMYEVALISYYGMSTINEDTADRDFERAIYWLRKVADSDHDLRFHALNLIARMYYQGHIPDEPQSYEKAFKYHLLASEKCVASVSGVAFMKRIGVGCEFDFEGILEYYKHLIHSGDSMAVMAQARFLTSYGKYNEALELFESMETVSPEAEYQIGLLYKSGAVFDPPKPDYIQAAYYFRNAAEENHLQAAFEYAMMCFRPTGKFKKNFKDAEKYFTIAADGGIAEAQYMLGCMYNSGHVTKDKQKAIFYFEKARSQGHSLSAFELSLIYQQSAFKNYEQAFNCASLAASHGMAEGEFILGNLLFWGRGCQSDINKALEMYTKAYDHGLYNALIMKNQVLDLKKNLN